MQYPTIQAYKDAVSAQGTFQTQQLQCVMEGNDVFFVSGSLGVVFKMLDSQGKQFAVKCFMKEIQKRQEAYQQIAQHFATLNSSYLLPYEYLNQELWADNDTENGDYFPIVKMQWLNAPTMANAVKNACEASDTAALRSIAEKFDEMALWLLQQPFAHGDVKPDNILLRPDHTPVLIDYDGVFVPAMAGTPAREGGSPSFAHPKRAQQPYNADLDDFSLLVISLGLHALAEEPSLYAPHQTGENLLLSHADYQNPQASALLTHLRSLAETHEHIGIRLALLQYALGGTQAKIMGLASCLATKTQVKKVQSTISTQAAVVPTSTAKLSNPILNTPEKRTAWWNSLDANWKRMFKKFKISDQPNDTELQKLVNLTTLLFSSYNQISDLRPLSSLVNLTSLNCWNNQISDLSPLSSLVNLTTLDCSNNQISDLRPLSSLVNLTSLNCWNNQISDLRPLSALMNLRRLYCSGNRISKEEVARLREILPNCKISY